MQKFLRLFRDSARELKSPRTLAVAGMLIALNVVMAALNIRIQFTPDLRVDFGFLCSAMIGMLFGPVVAMIGGAATDILEYLVNTGGASYFPGFTLTAILGGLVWGMVFYRKQVTILRAFCAKFTINLFLNVGLNSLWLYLLYNKAFFAGLPLRALKNLVMLPVEIFMLVMVAGVVATVTARLHWNRTPGKSSARQKSS